MISSYIDSDDTSILDIGCADGYLTSKLHNKGTFSVGVDRAEHMLALARSRGKEFDNGLGFMRYEITPDSVVKLPQFDLVLLLTVYHHWVREYGIDSAEQMLVEINRRCEKLFFEPPGRGISSEVPKLSGQSIEDYWESYLEEVLPRGTDITLLGMTTYTDGSRSDPVFLIQT